MKLFFLRRDVDVSGLSGIGLVARGVQWPDGRCTLWWGPGGSIGYYETIEDVAAIHGHHGLTHIVWTEECVDRLAHAARALNDEYERAGTRGPGRPDVADYRERFEQVVLECGASWS